MRSFLRFVGRGKRFRKRLGAVRVVERADYDEMELDARVAMIQSLVPLAMCPGGGNCLAESFTKVGSNIFPTGTDGTTGIELWVMSDDVSGVKEEIDGTSAPISLLQNYPNPVGAATRISSFLAAGQHVRLTVYDVNGRQVQTLVHQWQSAGAHRVDMSAGGLPDGTYLYRLETDSGVEQKKMLLISWMLQPGFSAFCRYPGEGDWHRVPDYPRPADQAGYRLPGAASQFSPVSCDLRIVRQCGYSMRQYEFTATSHWGLSCDRTFRAPLARSGFDSARSSLRRPRPEKTTHEAGFQNREVPACAHHGALRSCSDDGRDGNDRFGQRAAIHRMVAKLHRTIRGAVAADEAVFAEVLDLGANSRLQLGTVDGTPRSFEN